MWLKETILATQNIKVLLFDLGGVIIDLYPQQTISAFAHLANKMEEEITAAHQEAALFQQYEKGLISNETFRLGVRQQFKFLTPDPAFDKAWNAMLGDIPSEILASVETLKTKYKCCVLSNTNAIHEKAFHQILAKQHGLQHLNELFDKVYFSHELNERKPDEAIYLKVISDLGLQADEVLFLDDSEVNIAAAQAVGMHGIYIPRNGGFIELLNAYLKG